MNDNAKTKAQLLTDIKKLHNQINRYKTSERKHKLAEKAFLESEGRYKDVSDIIEHAHELILSVAPDGRVLSANRAWQETIGYSGEEVHTCTIFEMLDDVCQPYFLQIVDLAMSGETVDKVETTFISKGGKRVNVEGKLYYKRANGNSASIWAIFNTISVRKGQEDGQTENENAGSMSETLPIGKQKEAVQERERWLSATLKSIGDAVISIDHDGEITFMNPAAEALTGWKHDNNVGRKVVFKSIDDKLPSLSAAPEEPTRPDDIMIHLTEPPLLITRDGTRIPIKYSSAPVEDDEGNIRGLVLVLHDIIEHKWEEDALRKARDELKIRVNERTADRAEAIERLRILKEAVETMRIGVTITDTTGIILYTNPADAKMHGYSVEELLGQNVRMLAPSQRRNPMTSEQVEEMQGRVRESVNIRKDSSEFPVWLMSSVVKDMAGKTLVIVTTCEDISERKQVEEALSEERNLLRLLIDTLPEHISVKDLDGCFLMNNMAHVRFLGAARSEELIGKTLFDFFSEELATQDDTDDQNVLRTGHPSFEHEHIIVNLEGHKRLHSTSKMPLRNGQGEIVGLLNISRDISKHEQLEEGLRLLEKALETMQLGVTLASLNGEIIYTNRADAEMHGYQIEELLGKNVGIFAPPELKKPLALEHIKGWKGLIRESVNIRKDGTSFPVWLMSEIVKNSKGNPCAIVTSCEDISKRKV